VPPLKDESKLIEREPDNEANACVIWLHGLGADGNDFASIVDALDLPDEHGIRFIFPHAPFRPVTINDGMMMRAWYDIFSLDRNMKDDEEGIRETQILLEGLVKEQIDRGIPANRIMLAGFSQGGCIAIHTGLRYQQQLAGIMGLSTYLPLRDFVAGELQSCQQLTRIMMMHGLQDTVVNYDFGRLSYEALEGLDLNVEWLEYPMEHTVCSPQLQDISHFIRSCLQ
jgi:phospholipase/carboxylesterase